MRMIRVVLQCWRAGPVLDLYWVYNISLSLPSPLSLSLSCPQHRNHVRHGPQKGETNLSSIEIFSLTENITFFGDLNPSEFSWLSPAWWSSPPRPPPRSPSSSRSCRAPSPSPCRPSPSQVREAWIRLNPFQFIRILCRFWGDSDSRQPGLCSGCQRHHRGGVCQGSGSGEPLQQPQLRRGGRLHLRWKILLGEENMIWFNFHELWWAFYDEQWTLNKYLHDS